MGEHSDKALGSLRTFRIHYQHYILPLVPLRKAISKSYLMMQ